MARQTVAGAMASLYFCSLSIAALPLDAMLRADDRSACAIAEALQGEFMRQDDSKPPRFVERGVREEINYEMYFVGPSAVSHWGNCFAQDGPDSYVFGLTRVGGYACYRCFTILQRTPNVLQAATIAEDFCYETVDQARRSCRKTNTVSPGEGVILWRANNVKYQYCPMDGVRQFSYSHVAGLQCPFPANRPSRISNCRMGFQMDLQLRGCNFPDSELSFRCLGTWDAGRGNGEQYFAVYNTQAKEYRCGMFNEKSTAGIAFAALSNDSTCSNMIFNSSQGYENFALIKGEEAPWPAAVSEEECAFPSWLVGDWQLMRVQPHLITYFQHYEPDSMMTVRGRCVGAHTDNKFRLFSRSHCGDAIGYHCVWFRWRSAAVVDFRMGARVSADDDPWLCERDDAFANSSWVTLATESAAPSRAVPCATPGAFGTPAELRLAGSTCFNVSVDCAHTYQTRVDAFRCDDGAPLDSTLYRCLAAWMEDDFYFSYVTRVSDNSKGCFVSQMRDGFLFMKWTGNQCERKVNFLAADKDVLFLKRTDSCYNDERVSAGKGTSIRPFIRAGDDKLRRFYSTDSATKQTQRFLLVILPFLLLTLPKYLL